MIGGAEIAVKEITDRNPDVDFVMVTARLQPGLSEHERVGNVEVHRIGKGNSWDKFRLIWQGPVLAKNLGSFDVVWSIMASYAGFAALRYKKQHLQTPYLLTLQEGDSRWDIYKHVWWCWPYFKQIFTKADRIQAISTYLKTWAVSLGAKCPIDVVPNGVAEQFFQVSSGESVAKRIVTVSRLVKKNGVDILIRALALLDTETTLAIVGDGELRADLVQIAKEIGVADRVQFLGNVGQLDLPQFLHSAQVFCRPSRSEGLGNAFLEAMAAGLPVVGTCVGGIPDFLSDGVTGLFALPDDPKDLAEKIQRLFSDQILRTRLQEHGKKLVKEKYEWSGIALQMKKIFTEML